MVFFYEGKRNTTWKATWRVQLSSFWGEENVYAV